MLILVLVKRMQIRDIMKILYKMKEGKYANILIATRCLTENKQPKR